MTQQYHISRNGEPGPCMARLGPCPLGEDTKHFSSKEEAESFVAKEFEATYGVITTIRKPASVKVDEERLTQLKAQGFIIEEGKVSHHNPTEWGENLKLSYDGKTPAIDMPGNFHFKLELEEGPDGFELTYYTYPTALTVSEAQGYADEADQSRIIGRQALAQLNNIKDVYTEVYGETNSKEIKELAPFQPTPFPYNGYEITFDAKRRVDEIIPAYNNDRIKVSLLVEDDDPHRAPLVRVLKTSHEKLNDSDYQEYLYNMRKAVLTGKRIYAEDYN